MEVLPVDALYLILSQFKLHEIVPLLRVAKFLNVAAKNNRLWWNYLRIFTNDGDLEYDHNINYKEILKRGQIN